MASGTTPVYQRDIWKKLAEHQRKLESVHLRALFDDDPDRGERLALEAVGLYLDYSKNLITDETLALLLQLADAADLRALSKLPLREIDLDGTDIRFDTKTPDLQALRKIWPNCTITNEYVQYFGRGR